MTQSDDKNDNKGLNKNVNNSKSFKYKRSITGSTYNVAEKLTNTDGNGVDNPAYDENKSGTKETEIAVLLKHLVNFWNSLNKPFVSCDLTVSLTLTWSANCVITSMGKRKVTATQRDNLKAAEKFKITDTRLHVPVVTLSTENDNKTFRAVNSRIQKNYKLV